MPGQTMEEYELDPQIMGGGMPWSGIQALFPQPVANDELFGLPWIPNLNEGNFDYTQQSLGANPGPLVPLDTLDLWLNNISPVYVDDTFLTSTEDGALAPVFEMGDFSHRHDHYVNIDPLNATDSSKMSETFSPSSEHTVFSFPSSPTAFLGSSHQHPYPVPGLPSFPIESSGAFNFAFGDLGNIEVQAPEPRPPHRPGRQRNTYPVGHSRIPKREQRKTNRPERCCFCNKGFPFKADLQKHIDARHTVNKKKYRCRDCPKEYTRKDRVHRHGKDKHGWPAGGDKRRRRTVDGGQHQ